ncbi:unnamed protein product [Mytilus edulis]|uniref:MAM domain-containing protein n=1 Tax=Mytilus edulis TaxID=6550 RepID=A0A8S3TB45_MYTED|nr:unnamed protein product [Mytilus edulis]
MLIHELQFGLYLNQYEICNQRNMITHKNEINLKLTILDIHLHIINVPFIKSYCTIYYVIRACFTSTLILRYGILDQSCPMQDRLHFFCILDKSQTTNLEKISTESSTMFGAGIPVIIISTMVVMIVAAVVIIVIVCNRKRRAKKSKLCQTPQNTTAAEIIDSSDYNVINYNEMTDISIRKINENKNKTHTKQHQPQNIQNSNENICNKYESLSTKRTSVEHIYESDLVHTNQYESLTNQRELDTNTYESTEQGLPQNMKTSIEQDENICNRYESLSTNRNSAEHMYESDTIPINHYQSLKQQKGLEEHTYESTKHALPVSMNQELSQYESLTIPPGSDKHTYESTEHASQVSMKQEASQYESLTNPPESDKHVYASTKSPRIGYNDTISRTKYIKHLMLEYFSNTSPQNIGVQEEETICRQKPCVLNSQDTQTIEDNCNENGTTISTFEEDHGNWKFDSSNDATWTRHRWMRDHTRVNFKQKGWSINAFSFNGEAGSKRIVSDIEFHVPICLSLWYQFYFNAYDCLFGIFMITDEDKTLLFTVDGNSTSFNKWINISVNANGKDPFKIALEADFTQRNSTATRFILIDDTSISYRPCKGQQVYSGCHDLKEPVEIECETQYLASEIEVFIEPKHLTSQLKNCPAESSKNEINSFCRNLNKTDKCKFSVLNFTTGYEDCYISNMNISVSFQCIANIPVIIVSTLVILIVAAIVVIVIVCNRRKRAKKSQLCQTQQNTTAAEMIDSSDYNVINYEEMKDISIRKINENTDQTHTTQHQPQNIKTTIEQDKNICNEYESCLTKRTSVEHIYESDSIHTNQYESLTNRQELDTHAYESTEDVLPQNKRLQLNRMKTFATDTNYYQPIETQLNIFMSQTQYPLVITNH